MAQRDVDQIAQAASLFGLAIPRTALTGAAGENLGTGVGSSLEFQDYREYTPGDDLRHVDWAAFARTDTLMVRLYREEVSPTVEIVLDASASMASDPQKRSLALNLASFFIVLARAHNSRPVLWLAGERVLRHAGDWDRHLDAVIFDATVDLASVLAANRPQFAHRSLRVVISDFLFPHDAETSLQVLSKGAASLALLQILSTEEAQPAPGMARRLVDVETHEYCDIVLSEQAVATYKERLERLKGAVSRAARRIYGAYSCIVSDRSLLEVARQDLYPAGIVEAR